MKSLLIVGAGEYGQLVKELATTLGYNKIGFLDDNSSEAIGQISDYSSFSGEYSDFVVAIGNPIVRKEFFDIMSSIFTPVTLVSTFAYISPTAVISPGCIIESGSVINTAANVGIGCIINAGAVINHNSKVSDFCQVDCNAVIAAGGFVPEGMKIKSGQVWDGRE